MFRTLWKITKWTTIVAGCFLVTVITIGVALTPIDKTQANTDTIEKPKPIVKIAKVTTVTKPKYDRAELITTCQLIAEKIAVSPDSLKFHRPFKIATGPKGYQVQLKFSAVNRMNVRLQNTFYCNFDKKQRYVKHFIL